MALQLATDQLACRVVPPRVNDEVFIAMAKALNFIDVCPASLKSSLLS